MKILKIKQAQLEENLIKCDICHEDYPAIMIHFDENADRLVCNNCSKKSNMFSEEVMQDDLDNLKMAKETENLLKEARIGKDDVSLIMDKVGEIFTLMDRLQGVYKFLPERKHLMEFQLGMQRVLPYAEAKSNKQIKQ